MPSSNYQPSALFVQYLLQPRSNSKNRSVPKYRSWSVFPLRVWPIEDGLIPMEPSLHAAVGLQLSVLLLCDPSHFLRDKMFRIPKLSCSAVRNPRQRAPVWRPPIGCKDRLPNNQHAHLSVRVPRKELLGCGRPPQTTWSSRGQQQHHPGKIGIAVKSGSELAQICIREHRERFLAGGN